MEKIQKIESIICKVIELIISLILGFMVVAMTLQVVTRYFVAVQVTWVEDVSVLCIQWITGLGVPLAWFKGTHLEMDITNNLYPEKVKKTLYIILQVVAVYASIQLIKLGNYSYELNKGFTESAVGYDESFRYVPLIICGYLLLIAASFKFLEAVIPLGSKKGEKV